MSFILWKSKIDKILNIFIKKDTTELPDLPYWDMWKQNTDPVLIAIFIITNNNYNIPEFMYEYKKNNIANILHKISLTRKPI